MPAICTRGPIWNQRRTYMAGQANMLRGTPVCQGADDNHVVAAILGNLAFGVLEESSVNVGDPISVIVDGEAVGLAASAIQAGQPVMANNAFMFIPSTAIGDLVTGIAVTSSSGVFGEEFLVQVGPFIR